MVRWAFGMSLAVGVGMVGCGPKADDGMETVGDSQDDNEADAVTYAGPDEDTAFTEGNDTVNDPTPESDAVTYAGPDETWSTSFDSSTSTSETTYDPTDADAVTYAGPDEDTSTTEPPASTSSESTGGESETTDDGGAESPGTTSN